MTCKLKHTDPVFALEKTSKMIKSYLIVVAAFLAVLALAQAQGPKPLPLENLDVENTLKNDKLVRRYIDCVLDRGRCDSNGKDIKGTYPFLLINCCHNLKRWSLDAVDILPRVLNEKCASCSPKQKANADRIVDFMKSNHMNDWVQVNAKYGSG